MCIHLHSRPRLKTSKLKRYGLIGYPLGHSWSSKWWNQRFADKGLNDHIYEHLELADLAGFSQLLKGHPDLRGLNVTIPHKAAIIPFLDQIDPIAEKIGAVNTILIKGGLTTGYNTDAEGFRKSIRPFLEPSHDRALILGSGGASKAVQHTLNNIGIQCYRVSRRSGGGDLTYSDLNEAVFSACKLVVNCTPVGMKGEFEKQTPIQTEFITPRHFVVDLVYNPVETRLLSEAKSKGATVLNGEDMLRFQAEEAWRIFQIGVKDTPA